MMPIFLLRWALFHRDSTAMCSQWFAVSLWSELLVLDLSAAFDTLDNIFLQQLHVTFCLFTLMKWLQSYLINCVQSVIIKESILLSFLPTLLSVFLHVLVLLASACICLLCLFVLDWDIYITPPLSPLPLVSCEALQACLCVGEMHYTNPTIIIYTLTNLKSQGSILHSICLPCPANGRLVRWHNS